MRRRYSFTEALHRVCTDGEETHFYAELTSPTNGRMVWQGSVVRGLMALAFEATYGTAPAAGWRQMPFASTSAPLSGRSGAGSARQAQGRKVSRRYQGRWRTATSSASSPVSPPSMSPSASMVTSSAAPIASGALITTIPPWSPL
jgi:hypothetical protein